MGNSNISTFTFLCWCIDKVRKEVATVTRVDDRGNVWKDAIINNNLYVVNTIGGGEYQKKYGGAFLDKLQKL